MDWLATASTGIRALSAEATIKDQALKYLTHWLAVPEFAAYLPQLRWLIEQQQWAGLLDRFYQILPFGTGGRRGPVGIGPNRMNMWTLGASVQGHCEYLKERFPGVQPLQVALAYDVRQFEDKNKRYNSALPNPVLHLSSRAFAQYAAGVYVANGIHAYILPDGSKRYQSTPELSFTIRRLKCHGGLNISASHNPPDDNGGKFYDERGGQPVPPDDQIMADLVEQVTAIKSLTWSEATRSGRIHWLDDEPHKAYLDLCLKQSLVPPPKSDEIRVVFTPLHGVGSMQALEVLSKQGFRITPVEDQMRPDGQFPNVTQSPNPEVPASLDRAENIAREIGADLVIATDPDADRLGGMSKVDGEQWTVGSENTKSPSPSTVHRSPTAIHGPPPTYAFLTGNSLAAMLTYFKLAKLSASGQMPASPIVITTLVTTSMVTRIARQFGCQVVDNLMVGFKYIADVLWHLEQSGQYEDVRGTPADLIVASEESHGILVTPHIRDKDGGASALLLAELALDQKRKGKTVEDYWQGLLKQFGYFKNDLANIAMSGVEGKQEMAKMLDLLRQSPPREIGGLKVTSFEDLRNENCWLGPIKGATDFAARNFLIFRFGDQARIALRPSGTEPKAKAYVEVSSAPCKAGTPDAAWLQNCRQVDALAAELARDFLSKALGLVGIKK
jgi:phosphoglucomutase